MPPPDDYHYWAKPVSDACPDCRCCSARLCATAKERDSFCDFVGTPGDLDLSECPCAGSAKTGTAP